MCVRYLIPLWERDSISLWGLELGICSSRRSFIIVVCIVPLILAMIVMGGSTIHPSGDRSGWRMVYLSSLWWVAFAGNLSLH